MFSCEGGTEAQLVPAQRGSSDSDRQLVRVLVSMGSRQEAGLS